MTFDPRKFKKPPTNDLKKILTPLQYEVTQNEDTERPFQNPFHDLKAAGLYVDLISGEPLFSSLDKFDSGCGWPSFSRPLSEEFLVKKPDYKIGEARIEVRSKWADSHLGHVFTDGPRPTGLRYCINSASLRFIPVDELEAAGYGEFLGLFTNGPQPNINKDKG